MELLNNKLVHRSQWDQEQVTVAHLSTANNYPQDAVDIADTDPPLPQVVTLMQLTSDLLRVVGKCPNKVTEEEEAEQAINRQTALYSLKLLCRSFGTAHQEVLLPVLTQSIDIISSPQEDKNVTGSALLCAAEVVSTLKALAIPHLPR